MEFDLHERETDVGTQYLPRLPVLFNGFPIGNALVDTGATIILLPMILHEVIGVELDRSNALTVLGAGGEIFKAYPSSYKGHIFIGTIRISSSYLERNCLFHAKS